MAPERTVKRFDVVVRKDGGRWGRSEVRRRKGMERMGEEGSGRVEERWKRREGEWGEGLTSGEVLKGE